MRRFCAAPLFSSNMKTVELYTDGACRGNPGPGGWAAILVYGAKEKELSGGEASTTNNRMELMGAISGLSALKEPCREKKQENSCFFVCYVFYLLFLFFVSNVY